MTVEAYKRNKAIPLNKELDNYQMQELIILNLSELSAKTNVSWGAISGTLSSQTDLQNALNLKQNLSGKDASGGYAGLTLFKINFKNALNTFTSFFTNSNTAARTYTFQDRNGTIADDTDLALKTNKIIVFNTQTDDYTLVASDADKVVEMDKATANDLTVPANVFSGGQQIIVAQYGAGQTTIVAGGGMTLRADPGLLIAAQYGLATILFRSATEAYVAGNLSA